MRRGCSGVLFFIGGWLLATVGVVGLMPANEEVSSWTILAFCIAFAAPFLLIGAWISPGNRLAELGLTMMIGAGVAVAMVLVMAAFAFDRAIERFMPEPLPPLDFTSPAMILSILLLGGGGYVVRRIGNRQPPTKPG